MDGTDLMEKAYLILVFIYSVCHITSGEVTVSTTPSNPSSNGKVNVECVVALPRDVSADSCRIWWSRTVYPRGRHYSSEGLHPSANMHIYTMYDTGIQKYRSVIDINQLTDSLQGLYTCNLLCPDFTQSANVDLNIFEPLMHMPSVVGMSIVGISIMTAVLIGICVKCCSARFPHRQGVSRTPSASTLSSMTSDAPPRYSVAVEATENGVQTVLRNVINPQHSVYSISRHDRASIYSIAFVGTPPPDYGEAILDLEKKGIFFNSASLEPMPPAYCDVRHLATKDTDTQEP